MVVIRSETSYTRGRTSSYILTLSIFDYVIIFTFQTDHIFITHYTTKIYSNNKMEKTLIIYYFFTFKNTKGIDYYEYSIQPHTRYIYQLTQYNSNKEKYKTNIYCSSLNRNFINKPSSHFHLVQYTKDNFIHNLSINTGFHQLVYNYLYKQNNF